MSPTLHHECTRVPVTALAACGALLIAAEGPYLRFYHAKTSKFVASKRVFKAQAVHGISVYAEETGNVTKLVVWGGRLVRALQISAATDGTRTEPLSLRLSNVVKAQDWILDLAPLMSSLRDENVYDRGICAAVTAHNALLEITIESRNSIEPSSGSLNISISELTTSSRSILYSAHLLWESSNCILVAAGTGFGEIMYWSWTKPAQGEARSQIHQVFLGHEGSIFDVRISQELQRGCCGNLKRVIASCSDDRTIRLWDVSDVNINANGQEGDLGSDVQRTRHTGFSVAAADEKPETSNCLAIGWGHTSRVWRVQFLESSPCDGGLGLISAGEDATSRTWKVVASIEKGVELPCALQQTHCSTYHDGKNMWSIATYFQDTDFIRVASGAADGKLATHPLVCASQHNYDQGTSIAEYTLQDLVDMAKSSIATDNALKSTKASKKGDSIRSYCFISEKTFLLITNTGKVLVESFRSTSHSKPSSSLTTSTLVHQLDDLSGYSTCIGSVAHEIAFLAGTKGSIYLYSARDSSLRKIHDVTGKVGALFATDVRCSEGPKQLALLITLVGQKHSQLLLVDTSSTNPSQPVLEAVSVPISDTLTGSTVTSMSLVDTDSRLSTLLVGYRRGSIALYSVPRNIPEAEASLFRVIEKVHGDETVTGLMFRDLSRNSPAGDSDGYMYSVGRDGCLAVHFVDFSRNTVTLIHSLASPIGPNIEDLYIWRDHLLVHGFSSKKWVLYDMTAEEEVMGVETGGAHRSWAFQRLPDSDVPGGSLVWTRTSSLHICTQTGANHNVLSSGGHGREIKAVAVSSPVSKNDGTTQCRTLIATGAEDTDIKIFVYDAGELICKRTLRKHTTGIQHLQWSDDGEYLFSSAGNEEFYIWRVRSLPTFIDIGVVCEHVYTPESEFSDLRILSFDAVRHSSFYTIALVFSDSSVKTYRYTPTLASRWRPLARGIYSTSCLTQTFLLSPTLLVTAGTDGHATFWPLSPLSSSPPSASSTPSALPSPATLTWTRTFPIHQNNAQTMAAHNTTRGTLLISGGDDGALAFVLVRSIPGLTVAKTEPETGTEHGRIREQAPGASPISTPVILSRAHASAVTACAILAPGGARSEARSEVEGEEIHVLTAGNDEWVRLWHVTFSAAPALDQDERDIVSVRRVGRCKTSVADVSSMGVLQSDEEAARVLVCGVGMEVIRVEYGDEGERDEGERDEGERDEMGV